MIYVAIVSAWEEQKGMIHSTNSLRSSRRVVSLFTESTVAPPTLSRTPERLENLTGLFLIMPLVTCAIRVLKEIAM